MTDEEEFAQIHYTAEEIDRITQEAYREILDNLDSGMEPRKAVAQVMEKINAKWNADFMGVMQKALEKVLQRSIGPDEIKAYPIGGLKLSQRLYHNSKEVSAVVNNIIKQNLQGWHSARELALQIYEGYDFKKPLEEPLNVKAPLPKYLRAAFGDDAAFQQLWEQAISRKTLKALAEDVEIGPALARIYARAKAQGLKTPYLKAAYLQALDDLEAGKGMARLAKQLKIAFFERNRYFANRIAQTEIHRAQSTERAVEIMGETDMHWVQIKLSSKHPKTDICNLHAQLNAYGLGPGIYPKAKAPLPPYHPHCICLVRPRIDLEPDARAKFKPDAERVFLEKLPHNEARQIAGSEEKLQRVKDGESLEAILNENKSPLYHLKRLGEVASSPDKTGAPTIKPDRTPWGSAKSVGIAGDTRIVQGHPAYAKAKGGDLDAAMQLVSDIITPDILSRQRQAHGAIKPTLIGVHAVEGSGVNAIPQAMAAWMHEILGWPMDSEIVQSNRVGHTKSSGWHRLANQALFDGDVKPGAAYFLLDDFIGQGGTLANLRGFIEKRGGHVVDFMALTGKPYSSILAINSETLTSLRLKHGDIEPWWKSTFGFGFDALTESEARYLLKAENADIIRTRLAEAQQTGRGE